MILIRIFKKWDRNLYWIYLAQDRGRWRALVKAAMNLRVTENAGNFFINSGPVIF
jgi:hypothetical protein